MLFYTISVVASQNSSCVLRLVGKCAEPNFIYLSHMVQNLEQWAKFHFHSVSERGCVKARLGADGIVGEGLRCEGEAEASLSLSLRCVLRPLGCRWACWWFWGPLWGTRAWRGCVFLFPCSPHGEGTGQWRLLWQLWPVVDGGLLCGELGSWGGESLGLPVLLPDSRLGALPSTPVLVCQGYHNNVPQTAWLKQQKLTF